MIERNGMNMGGWGSGQDLEEIGGGKTIIKIYCMEKYLFSILFNKSIQQKQQKLNTRECYLFYFILKQLMWFLFQSPFWVKIRVFDLIYKLMLEET